MKVLVDTSVWVDFVNGYPSPQADALSRLIEERENIATCGLVAAEFLQGLKRERDRKRLEALFMDLTWLTPVEPDTYVASASMFRELRRRGITVRSVVDSIITRLAEENGCFLLARDRDIDLILESGVAKVRPLPG